MVLYPQLNPLRSWFDERTRVRILGRFADNVIGKYVIRRASFVVALTETEAEFCKQHGVENVRVVREPIRIRPRPDHEQSYLSSRLVGSRVILFVGRIERYKGLQLLVRALATLNGRFPDLKLVVAGRDCGYLRQCLKLAEELHCRDSVLPLGSITDAELDRLYDISEIVVVPSYYEGYSRVVLEGWAHGKPVIVTKGVGAAELVKKGGGIVVPIGSAGDLADAINTLIIDTDLASDLGKRGRQLLSAITLENAVAELDDICNSLVEPKR